MDCIDTVKAVVDNKGLQSSNKLNNKQFKYWRRRNLYSIMIGYGTFYLVCQNFSLAMLFICTELNINKVDIGLLISIGELLYYFSFPIK